MGATVVIIYLMIIIIVIISVILRSIMKKTPQFSKPHTTLWTILGAVFGFFIVTIVYNLDYYLSKFGFPELNDPYIYISLGIISLVLGIFLFGVGVKKMDKPMIAVGSGLLGFTSMAWFFVY